MTRLEAGHDELGWRAYQYYAGELSSLDSAAFERLLSEEVAACEALAEAVELASAVALVESAVEAVPERPRRPGWRARLGTCVAAATVVAVGAILTIRTGAGPAGSPGPDGPHGAMAETARTALAWSSLRRDREGAEEHAWSIGGAASDPTDWIGRAAEEPDEEPSLPSWLIASLDHDAEDIIESTTGN